MKLEAEINEASYAKNINVETNKFIFCSLVE